MPSSLERSYLIAIRSYDVVINRITVMDGRILSLLALSSAITAAIPILVRNSFLIKDTYFMAGLTVIFLATVLTGLYGLVLLKRGDMTDLDPRVFHADYLNLPDEQFMRTVIKYAGQHYKRNVDLLRWKWRCSFALAVLIVIETTLIIIWAGAEPSQPTC